MSTNNDAMNAWLRGHRGRVAFIEPAKPDAEPKPDADAEPKLDMNAWIRASLANPTRWSF